MHHSDGPVSLLTLAPILTLASIAVLHSSSEYPGPVRAPTVFEWLDQRFGSACGDGTVCELEQLLDECGPPPLENCLAH